MDKNDALRIGKQYVLRLKNSEIEFTDAYLFGSYATGNQHDNSDIDIAIVLKENVNHTFETDVKLMVFRKGDETMIEPHAFSRNEFDFKVPIVHQILKHGIKIV